MVRQIVLLTTLLICWNGKAAEDDVTKEAADHFKQGVALFNENKKEEAVREFRKAYELKPAWKINYNIGQCEASLRRYGLAIEAFERYLGEGGDEISVERRDEVIKELDRLRKMVGSVKIHGPEGYNIVIDGIERGQTPMSSSILVTVGVEHTISVNKEGESVLSVSETVSGGEILELTVPTQEEETPAAAVTPEPVAPPVEPTPEARETSTAAAPSEAESTAVTEQPGAPPESAASEAPPEQISDGKPLTPALFFVGVGTTVVFGGAAAGLGLYINSRWEKSEKKIKNDPWLADTKAISDNIRTLQIISWVSLGLAGAGLILTAVSIPFTDWGGRRSERPESSVSALTVAPFSAPSGGGVAFSGRF